MIVFNTVKCWRPFVLCVVVMYVFVKGLVTIDSGS